MATGGQEEVEEEPREDGERVKLARGSHEHAMKTR